MNEALMKGVALSALGTLAYTYVGYPILIEALSRFAAAPVRRDPAYQPTVSVLIPVFNAKPYVPAKLESLVEQDYPADKVQILLYSDASDDGSDEAVLELAEAARAKSYRGRIELLRGDVRKGKPTALNVMRQRATGEVFVLTDIRQPLSKNTFRSLVACLADPTVGAVSGNLILAGAAGAGFYWRYENRMRRAEGRFRSMIGVTGPLYAMRGADFGEVPTDIILDDMWIPLRLRLGADGESGKRLVQCEEAEAYDEAFADERELGRKIRTLAGNFQILAKMPALLSPVQNPIWFETMSHKVLRLAGPALMATAFASSVVALARRPDDVLMKAALGGQVGFAILAALGPHARKLGPRAGMLGNAARTFTVLNYAAVIGFLRHVQGSQKVTW
jgi:poly-beta-1,6-N-acetyl-D-glucosamine synthase